MCSSGVVRAASGPRTLVIAAKNPWADASPAHKISTFVGHVNIDSPADLVDCPVFSRANGGSRVARWVLSIIGRVDIGPYSLFS